MDIDRQIEVARKRNIDLQKRIEDLTVKLDLAKELNTAGYDKAKEMITDLDTIHQAWVQELNSLKKEREECALLISDIRKMRDELLRK